MSETREKSTLVLEGVPPRRSWWVRLLMVAGFLTLCGATAAAVAGVVVYAHYSRGLPEIPRVDEYRPAILSEVISADGVLSGEFYNERRKVVPYERIPKRLVQAFIASEDSSFFDHGGIDFVGTTRAAFNTVRKKLGLGGSVQGGSTLTQQTAKAILVTAEARTLDTEKMMVEAERSVPPVEAPTDEAVKAELSSVRRELRQYGYIRLVDGSTSESPTAEDLQRIAQERLRKQAELARQDAVARAFLRIRAEQQRAAFRKATAKTLERKIREAILARRLEAALSKEEILYLYLNNVYLGHHSYGVQSAAENYFRTDVGNLTLAEMALLAGLPQAPTRYSPFRNPEEAKRRRGYVLNRMGAEGMITDAELETARETPVKVFGVEDVSREFAPYFVEQVRRDVVARYGNAALLNEGLQIHTTMDSERQRAAQEAVFYGLLAVDKRQGFRGVLKNLPKKEWPDFHARGDKVLQGAKIENGRFYVGLVTRVENEGAEVQVGSHKGHLPLLGMRWARRLNPEGYYPAALVGSAKSVLKPGDVVVLRAVGDPKDLTDDEIQQNAELRRKLPEGVQLFRLEQEPELQSALVSIDPHRQYLVAMVGGYDFDANEYNRAYQACRQPGSAFKPLVYSAAIEKLNWTEATVIVDSPIVFDDASTEVRWKPQNYSEDFRGDVLLRQALVNSMNIPAVKTFHAVGIGNMMQWAQDLGLSTPLNPDLSAALGSSCVIPQELAGVYATFARYGNKRPTHFVRKIEDRFGRTLEDHTSYDDAWASLEDRIGGAYARLFDGGDPVMSRETGFITVDLLRGVVREGTGAAANRLGKPAAGKTGTTNDSFDAWFAGFTEDLVAVSWVGYDLNPHPLGRYETGGRASLPIWLSYMKRALDGVPQGEFSPPPGANLAQVAIDMRTGKLASSGTKDVRAMWFKGGTAPQEATPEQGTVDPNDWMMTGDGL